MTPHETLRVARSRGITIEAAGDKLRIAPAAAVDSALRDALAAHKLELTRLLGGPRLDDDGLPVDQCCVCGCPTWWEGGQLRWICDHCTPRAGPFYRVVIVSGGQWRYH